MDNLKVVIVEPDGWLGDQLGKAGYEVEIYDRVSELRPAGRISLWSNGVKVLNSLGLGKEIASIGGQMDRVAYYGRKTHRFQCAALGRSGWTATVSRSAH